MNSKRNKFQYSCNMFICFYLLTVMFNVNGCINSRETSQDMVQTAVGNPAEGRLEVFMGESLFKKQTLYTDKDLSEDGRVRFPNIDVAVDGTVLAIGAGYLRRSKNGGMNFSEPQKVPFRSLLVDENTRDIFSIELHEENKLWHSSDNGKTWKEKNFVLKPNDLIKWIEDTGIMKRVHRNDVENIENGYWLHTKAAESGITLRHGEKKRQVTTYCNFSTIFRSTSISERS